MAPGGDGSPGDGYAVDPEYLRTHAGQLRQVSDSLGQARAAGQQAAMGDEAYGHLPTSMAFVALVHAVSEPGLQALHEAQKAVNELADSVTDVASNYEAMEDEHVGALREFER